MENNIIKELAEELVECFHILKAESDPNEFIIPKNKTDFIEKIKASPIASQSQLGIAFYNMPDNLFYEVLKYQENDSE